MALTEYEMAIPLICNIVYILTTLTKGEVLDNHKLFCVHLEFGPKIEKWFSFNLLDT